MKTVSRCLLITLLLLSGSRSVVAQTIVFGPGGTSTFTIASAVAGQNPTSVSSAVLGSFTTTTKTNQGVLRIRALLNQAMPANTTLTLTLTYPTGSNQGAKSLTIAATDMVTSIPAFQGNRTGSVSYSFAATPSAGVVTPFTRTITLTIGP